MITQKILKILIQMYKNMDKDPDPLIFGPPDPDPLIFGPTDSDSTCNHGFIKLFSS